MKFYILEDADGVIAGCNTSKADALRFARSSDKRYGIGMEVRELTIARADKETIRRILGNEGGYASGVKTIYAHGREVKI